MSFFDYVFDSEMNQRADINALKADNKKLEELISATEKDLEKELKQMALLNKALMQILIKKNVCTGDEIIDLMHQLNDSEKTETICSSCNHKVSINSTKCLYCGADL